MNKNNQFDLKNKNIVVTGAAGLLGYQHLEAIIEFNGNPILIDINKTGLIKTKNKLEKKYKKKLMAFTIDITNEQEIIDSIKVIKKRFKKLDGLVNNAAINPAVSKTKIKNSNSLDSFTEEQWDLDIAVGLKGSFFCTKHYGSLISKNINGGSIVNISSDLGLIAPDQRIYAENSGSNKVSQYKPVSYSVVKSGIIGLTRYTSTFWVNKNVRCNAICPGGIYTNQSKSFLKKLNFRIPMGRMAKVYEYRGTLIWLLSDASSYSTGSVIAVDGGRTAW